MCTLRLCGVTAFGLRGFFRASNFGFELIEEGKTMTQHIANTADIKRRYRLFLVCFVAAVLLFMAMWGGASAANIVVNSLTDDGTGCTLREAIDSANGNANSGGCVGVGAYGADTITFSVTGTILLGSTLPNTTATGGLTIDGGSQVAISGANMFTVFIVNSGAALTLENLTVRDGSVVGNGGGIINNGGTVNITNSTLSGNSASSGGGGGGIFNGGTLAITDSTLS